MIDKKKTSIERWIADESVSLETFLNNLEKDVKLLGFGEALHGGEEILQLRNTLFKKLVKQHGFSAIAIESSFTRAIITNEYINGRGPKTYDEIIDTGYGSAFGHLEANRELTEWMKVYNADSAHTTKLRFYGLDIPSGTVGIGSPRQTVTFVLDFLTSVDPRRSTDQRRRIVQLLGEDNDWENPQAHMDYTKSIGGSPRAQTLRIETEDLIAELESRRPELIRATDRDTFLEVLQHAKVARDLLTFHASMAKDTTYAERLGIRDVLQAENLLYMVNREQQRGKVLAFAHNSHLKKGNAEWQLGPELITWWPAGSLLHEQLGKAYAVIGTAVGTSEENGISAPEPGSLEARFASHSANIQFLPTFEGKHVSTKELKTLPTRSGSKRNPTYFPLTAQSFTDFDVIAFVKTTGYNRGGPTLQDWE